MRRSIIISSVLAVSAIAAACGQTASNDHGVNNATKPAATASPAATMSPATTPVASPSAPGKPAASPEVKPEVKKDDAGKGTNVKPAETPKK